MSPPPTGSVSANSAVAAGPDIPIVTATKGKASVISGGNIGLFSLFHTTDPAKKAILNYQIYDSLGTDSLLVGKTTSHASSADAPLTASSLSAVKLHAGSVPGTDTVTVRAFNGTNWSDWVSVDVTVQAASAPLVAHPITDQNWTEGQVVRFKVPVATFSDPNHFPLTYSASQANGTALPGWLSFDATSETFSGKAPTSASTLSLVVTATDSSGLSVADGFTASIQPTKPAVVGPVLSHQTAGQTWTAGQFVHLTLPSDTFKEPGVTLTCSEKQLSGPDASGWLHFDPAKHLLSGWVPQLASGTLKIGIIGTDPAGHNAVDIFSALIIPSAKG